MPDLKILQDEASIKWQALTQGDEILITVGSATCGRSAGSIDVMDALQVEMLQHDLTYNIIEVGCIGLCYMEPIVSIKK